MKTPLIILLLAILASTPAFAAEPKNAQLLLLDAQISAENGHYKTLLELIADKKMAASISTSKDEQKQFAGDLAKLVEDKKLTEEQIEVLVSKYNAILKKK